MQQSPFLSQGASCKELGKGMWNILTCISDIVFYYLCLLARFCCVQLFMILGFIFFCQIVFSCTIFKCCLSTFTHRKKYLMICLEERFILSLPWRFNVEGGAGQVTVQVIFLCTVHKANSTSLILLHCHFSQYCVITR